MFVVLTAVGLRQKLVDKGLDLMVHFKNTCMWAHTPLYHCNIPFNSEFQTSVSWFSLSSSTRNHEQNKQTKNPPTHKETKN